MVQRESQNAVPHHDFGVFWQILQSLKSLFLFGECVDELEFWPDKNTLKQISLYEKFTFTCYVKEFTLDEETVLFCWWKKSSENSDLAFTPGIEMQFLLMPCFRFQRTRLKSNFHSRFNLAAAVSRLAIIAIIKCNRCDLRNLKIQTAWRSTCVCNCIKGHFLNSFLWPVNCNWFLSRSRLVCCRNATSAAMSPIKISTEKMCFFVAENTSVFESAENTSVFESVGQSNWAAAQSRVCSLFPSFLATHSGEKSTECNHCDLKPVMKQGAWGSTCEIASTWGKMFLSLWLASFKQTNRGSKKTMENTKTQGSQFKPTSFVWPLVLDGKFGDRLSCHVLSFYSYFVICIKAYSSCIFICICKFIWLLILRYTR